MDRLLKKWETSKSLVHKPELSQTQNKSDHAILYFGTSAYAVEEAMDELKEKEIEMDALRIRSFPFNQTVEDFIRAHKTVFVVEQNRDAQMKSLISIELQIDPNKLISVLNYDGMPITAQHISSEIFKSLFQYQH
jgi:2-oxoglutarate ferredoxin oxidoreductase subunit alpha